MSIQRDIDLFDHNIRHRVSLLGHALKEPILDVWITSGSENALRIIDDVNAGEDQILIRWIWLDSEVGDRYYPSIDVKLLSAVRKGNEFFIKNRDEQTGEEFLISYFPIVIPGHRGGALELSENLHDLKIHTGKTIKKILMIIGLMILVSCIYVAFVGFFVIGRRLNVLKAKALRIGMGDLSGSVNIKGKDELADLGTTLNSMCWSLEKVRDEKSRETEARLAAMEQLYHADRLKTFGSLASGIAHELGTPLSVVSGRAGLIIAKNVPDDVENSAKIIKTQSDRMTALVKQLLDFARIGTSSKKTMELRILIQQTIELMEPILRACQINLVFDSFHQPLMVKVDILKIQQVFTNLMNNALQAMKTGGVLEIGLNKETVSGDNNPGHKAGDFAFITIKDSGEGISKENMPHVFDPFFTTKESGKGTGLGLSIVQSIVQEHGGWITVRSEPGKGSCFNVFLPWEDE